tara:strand:- start:162 stop:806 length:645 start_codon:yes stop_codon:yes gene_type:complete
VLALGIGLGLNVLGSIAGANQRNGQIAAAHAARNNATYWRNHLKAQAKKNADYTSLKTFTKNHLSAGREYEGLQRVYGEKMKSLAFNNQAIIKKLYQSNIPQSTGTSAARMKTMQLSDAYQKLAINRATGRGAKEELNTKIESLYGWGGKLDQAQTAAWRGGNPVQFETYEDPAIAEAQMENPLISALPGLGSSLQTAGDIDNPFSGLYKLFGG